MPGLRITLGIVLAGFGVAIAVLPSWFAPLTGGAEPPVDVHHAIELRVRGGMVLGVGLALIAVTAFRPWSTSVPLAVFYFMAGALAARLLGVLVDGTVARQWLLVAVEAIVMAGAAIWLWRCGGTTP